MEVHLDLIGGLAGDMFIAALLDAFPAHQPAVQQAIKAVLGSDGVECSLLPHRDAVLQGHRFKVKCPQRGRGETPYSSLQPRAAFGSEESAAIEVESEEWTVSEVASTAHGHVPWKTIRIRLENAPLEPRVRAHAIGIFQLLARAEAHVHGIDPEAVTFHEVGAWDSIADIVGAAAIIGALDATRWSSSPAPIGSGRVKTAHGILPLPAPATARLLMGMPTIDDGIGGERVTPTGAAILRYLCPPSTDGAPTTPQARLLHASGTGFGTRSLPGLSNHLRALCFAASSSSAGGQRLIQVLEFEVDDQSAEDLATGLDRLRLIPAVLDVTQTPVFGKKGRLMMHIQVLARQQSLDQVVEACFRETTTIGLRHRTVQGIGLERWMEDVVVDGHPLRVKIVDRPGGKTAKVESDDVLSHQDHARRASLRYRGEQMVLSAERSAVDA